METSGESSAPLKKLKIFVNYADRIDVVLGCSLLVFLIEGLIGFPDV